jgi:hypothetical protein
MTDETVECFNCGRENPEWAQVCRSCGVVLRHGETRVVPTERVPTDRNSLLSIGAAIGTILVAVVLGLFVSSLNPTDPTVGVESSPSPSATPEATEAPSVAPVPTDTPVPTETPVPLPGTIAFGTAVENNQIVDPTTEFGPGTDFAYAVSAPNTFGGTPLRNEVVAVADDGTETVVLDDPVNIDPASTAFGFVVGTTDDFIGSLGGPGTYIWRAYVGEELIAEGTFTYSG